MFLLPFHLFSSIVHFCITFLFPFLFPFFLMHVLVLTTVFHVFRYLHCFFLCHRAFHFPCYVSCIFHRTKQMNHEKHIMYKKWFRTYSKMKGECKQWTNDWILMSSLWLPKILVRFHEFAEPTRSVLPSRQVPRKEIQLWRKTIVFAVVNSTLETHEGILRVFVDHLYLFATENVGADKYTWITRFSQVIAWIAVFLTC